MLVATAFTTNVPVQIDPPPVGHVMPYSTVTIHSQIGGMISEVHFKEGQEVKQGDCCSRLIRARRRRRWTQAQADLARDPAQLENAKDPVMTANKNCSTQKLVSQDQFDTSRASLDALAGTVAGGQGGRHERAC